MDAMTAYATQATATASPAQLVLMLYDGALARIELAENALTGPPDMEAAHGALTRAQAIVTELQASLDPEAGGVVAASLESVYHYVLALLLDTNLTKRPDRLPEAASLLRNLRDAWEQACCRGLAPAVAVG